MTTRRLDRALHTLFYVAILLLPAFAVAATLPDGFTEALVASGLSNPTAMQFAPDGRLFVAEQGGALRVIKNDLLLATPFVTVSVDSAGERGLLGIAFDPSFATNHYVYVYYTARSPAHNRISRFTANGDVAAGGETIIFEMDNLNAEAHNGGALAFGWDGKLYAAVGDNLGDTNPQSLNNVLGKIIRINKDGTIPADNPFYSAAVGKNRAIWALGLRNPFTFAFNPAGSQLFINDVGEHTWEEINEGASGANFGWPNSEGTTSNPSYTSPRYAYNHATGCAITGGTFYSPASVRFPASYVGQYFFADYCIGWIRAFDPSSNTVTTLATNISAPIDLKVSDSGQLYYLARGDNAIYRIEYGSSAPTITQQPASQAVQPGAAATFRVRASGAGPLQFQWQRDATNVAGATTQDYTLPSVAAGDNGARFRAIVTNSFGNVLSNEAILTVSGNQAPSATITLPVAGTTYAGGTAINYAGTGTDPEDGTLPPSAFTWKVDFHHDTHIHPFVPATSGASSGTFTIPTSGEVSSNVWYRIYLTVRDSNGVTTTTQRDITPRTVQVTVASNVAGLQLKLDGQPITSPTTFTGVVGITRSIEAVTPQTSGGTTYTFASWSDSGAAAHTISTPSANTTYTATFNSGGTGGASGTGLSATYFDNDNLTGSTVTRIDPSVDFDWGTGTPAPAIGAETFSARWTGTVQPQFTGTYTFYTQSNDGVRLWVNGQPLVDNWTGHAVTENSGTIALVAGQQYAIRMEYFEGTGTATARLLWNGPSTTKAVIPAARLFPEATTTTTSTVRLTLTSSPAGLLVKVDGQAVATPYAFDSAPGTSHTVEAVTPQSSGGTTYSFASWSDSGSATHSISTPTANATYTATFTSGSGSGGSGGGDGTGLSATYFDNDNLTGSTVTRVDPGVNFDWGAGSPAAAIGAETFSARWSGTVQPQFTGTYTFYTQSNDGVRLWVNGQPLVDNWTGHGVTEDSGAISLVAGQKYTIRMEYFEGTGTATARLLWSGPSTPKAVIPSGRLFP